ncbi:scaffoldin [Piromyces finnis]|uniref:Scaffoldin n=1 Tax=Piromyces finnis TaxID=1754191 RepID=A0A1Y1V1X5_9FUNG|nr:scaffoldin [Piromyces finnis]|eukprot:ORX44740.1 scaffoldin [Piromyces finnis]
MKQYFKLFLFFWLLTEYQKIFVNAYLKSISTCVIIDNQCIYNQLAISNSYCYEENTFRIYKTNIQNKQLKRRENNYIDKKKKKINNNINSFKSEQFKYYKKNDRSIYNVKKYENKFLSANKNNVNNTVLQYHSKINHTNNAPLSLNKEISNKSFHKKVILENFDINNDDKKSDIDNYQEPIRVKLMPRTTGLEDYSSVLCKIEYDNFSKRGIYLFDNNNRLINNTSIPIKTIYICQKDNSTSCHLPKENGFYLSTFQNREVIELSGLQNADTILQSIKPEDGYSFINAELLPKTSNKYERDIISCKYNTLKKEVLCNIEDGSNGSYYIQKKSNNKTGIIECSKGKCLLKNNILNGFYVNSAASSMNNTLIYCYNNNCSFKIAKNDQYYIGIQQDNNVMIECNNNKCFYNKLIEEGYYINSGTSIEDNDKPLIYCDSIHLCNSINILYYKNSYFISKAHTGHLISCKNDTYCKEDKSLANIGYYINGSQDIITSNPKLIYCSDEKANSNNIECKEVDITNTNKNEYFISGKQGYLITYKIVDVNKYALIHTHPEEGYFLNNNINNNTFPLIYCKGAKNSTLAISCQPTTSNNGYYLMQSSKVNINENLFSQLIFCENSKCQNKDPFKGYYIYALDSKQIISCNGRQCSLEKPDDCQATITPKFYIAGNCCIYQSQLSLITKSFNITNTINNGMEFKNFSIPLQSESTSKYAYFEVKFSEFPGMTVNPGSLYKVSNYSITYFPYDGYFILNSNNEQLLSLNTTITKYDINTMKIFNCNSSTESCIEEKECLESKFILYEPLKLGMKCTNSTLDVLTTKGSYLDDTNNSVIRCNDNKECKSLTVSAITNSTLYEFNTNIENCYLLNSGYKNTTDLLIKCNRTACELFEPQKGYYFDCEAKKIINYQNIKDFYYVNNTMDYPTYYINKGALTPSENLITCTKNNCIPTLPATGYYLSHNNNSIIHCKNSFECTEESLKEGYYPDANSFVNGTNYIIHCALNSINNMNCYKEKANDGYYISIYNNTLINCINNDNTCNTISNKPGIYVSALLKNTITSNKLTSRDLPTNLNQKDRNLINCTNTECNQLSEKELMAIPICEFSNNKCFISTRYSSLQMDINLITQGGYCTNYYHSQLYFATDSINTSYDINKDYNELFDNININCIEASSVYRSYYYTIENIIYNIDDNQISQKLDNGLYFIDTQNHTLLNSNNIKLYNEDSIELYECNGEYCKILKNISSVFYFVDVNKHMFMFDPSYNKFFFPQNNNITCTRQDQNICKVSIDDNNEEFCIDTSGQLVFLQNQTTKSTRQCVMMEYTDSEAYVFSKNLYRLSSYSAKLIEEKGYYLINNNTRITAEFKDFNDPSQLIILYGCNENHCDEYKPNEGVYYYDNIMKSLFKYENNIWSKATISGYANISLYPGYTHVFKFDVDNDSAIIKSKGLMNGIFYTIDQKMFQCDLNKECREIEDTGYVMTSSGNIYYCEYNSKATTQKVYEDTSLESSNKGYRNILSSCIKQKCNVGEYYYLKNNYYQCLRDSIFSLMKMEQCIDYIDVKDIKENHSDIASTEGFGKYIIHFPLMDQENYPENIKYMNYLITVHNNSTAEDSYVSSDYLSSISGVFSNCRYDLETATMVFDLICINNYVSSAKQLEKQNEELLNKKDNSIAKGSMSKYDISGIISFLKKRKNNNDENVEDSDGDEYKNDSSIETNIKDKNIKFLEEFDISYKKNSDLFICSTKKYGYTECQKDKNNPNKCVPSKAIFNYKLSKDSIYIILLWLIVKILYI